MEHQVMWRGLVGFAVMAGGVVVGVLAAVVPDEFVGVAATVGAGLLAWTASTLWKGAATQAKMQARLDEHERRLNNLEAR